MSGSSSPLKAHSASPAELRERIEVDRRGRPFLVFRGGEHEQRILELEHHGERISVGRGLTNELSLPWDTEDSQPTQIAGERLTLGDLPPTQRQVLVALARPYKHDEFAIPATNQEIAGELHLSVDAVKSHLRSLFQRFGIEHLPQNQKRSRLVAEALQSGVLATRDL